MAKEEKDRRRRTELLWISNDVGNIFERYIFPVRTARSMLSVSDQRFLQASASNAKYLTRAPGTPEDLVDPDGFRSWK